MNDFNRVVKTLAAAFLCGSLTVEGFEARSIGIFGKNFEGLWVLCVQALTHHLENQPHSNIETAISFIRNNEDFYRAWVREGRPEARFQVLNPVEMGSRPTALAKQEIRDLANLKSLSEWLDITPEQLGWYAGEWEGERRVTDTSLRNYVYRWILRKHHSPRLIEAPKSHLRRIQRKIYQEILSQIPPHQAAHGFTKGHSCLTFCLPHTAQQVVMRLDLRSFFPAIHWGRVKGLFQTLGYPREVTRLLSQLCTNQVPDEVLLRAPKPPEALGLPWQTRKMYQSRHLPQGAPTSPALANLCAFRLDLRLSGAARKIGATYTRYADDLAFSGDLNFRKNINGFYRFVDQIVREEGFAVNPQKTLKMAPGVRQKLTGIVLNKHPNIPRNEFDILKATLYNCVRFSPESQNRGKIPDFRAHLMGRVAYVKKINPRKGLRLAKLYGQIKWNS